MDKRGNILELKKNCAVIMTEDCEFQYIKKRPGMFVGQQINFDKKSINKFKNNIIRYAGLVACFLTIILVSIMSYSKFNTSKDIYAYVDIDINPSLEVAINKDNKVIFVKPINEDGKMLLKSLKLKGETLETAISEILNQSRHNGYIKSQTDNYVLIAMSLNPETIEYKKKLNYLLDALNGIAEENGKERIITRVIDTSWETRNLANQNNISTGKYTMYTKAKDLGLNLSIDEVRNNNLSDILKKLDIDSKINGYPGNSHNTDKPKDIKTTTPTQEKEVNKAPVISEAPTWTVGINYTIGTVISYNQNKYKCITTHISQSDWQPSNVPALWQKQVVTDSKNTWQTGVSYTVATIVTYKGVKYKCLQAHDSLEGWEPPNVPALWQKP
ncbi:MAG: anti-sigma factor domain-containing protein [Clostridiaceae bacterium]|nr:anti-sigma factor domain-containing protein [Clostridiaceae bacterium]